MSRVSTLVAVVLILPGVAAGQRRGPISSAPVSGGGAHAGIAHTTASMPPHFSVRLQPSAPRASGGMLVRGHGIRTNHRARVNVVPFGTVPGGTTDFQDVPGLGFDYPHLAAVSGNGANRNPHFRNFGGVFPFGFNGFLLGAPPVILEQADAGETGPEEQQAQEAQEVMAENYRLREAVRLGRSRYRAAESAPVSRDSAPSAAVAPAEKDVAEYVFVRRDGGLVFAVGYMWEKDTLRYVTREGMRHSITRDALDLSATHQFNEQRGLNFHSPRES